MPHRGTRHAVIPRLREESRGLPITRDDSGDPTLRRQGVPSRIRTWQTRDPGYAKVSAREGRLDSLLKVAQAFLRCQNEDGDGQQHRAHEV